jgi:hypothetical protein
MTVDCIHHYQNLRTRTASAGQPDSNTPQHACCWYNHSPAVQNGHAETNNSINLGKTRSNAERPTHRLMLLPSCPLTRTPTVSGHTAAPADAAAP